MDNIYKWICVNYPDEKEIMDDVGFNKKATFSGAKKVLESGEMDIYDYLHTTESIHREFVFGQLSEIYGLPYTYFYDLWLGY